MILKRNEIEKISNQIKKEILSLYGSNLINILIFGSYSRNSARDDSDLDIALILKGNFKKTIELNKIYDILYDLILESKIHISIVLIKESEFINCDEQLIRNIKEEGIPV